MRTPTTAPIACRVCGGFYGGPYRMHLNAAGHARSRPARLPHVAFLAEVAERADRTIAEIGADHGLTPEAAKRAAARAGLFRRGRRLTTLACEEQIVRRASEGVERRVVAQEFGISLSHVYYVLRVARSTRSCGSSAQGVLVGRRTPAP